jgi:glutamate 5-kinase
MKFPYKRLVIKIGSNVLTQDNGLPDLDRIQHLVEQISAIKKQGKDVIVISSGAVASGRSSINISDKFDAIASRQLLASIGQVKLINTYSELFERHQLICAQVLVTKEDFRDRVHYLNMKNCFEILLQNNVVPIVNENDVVSVTELMFTDNDELAGLVASMLNAEALIILTNVDGIYNGDPKNAGSSVITEIDHSINSFSAFVTSQRSQFGRGGMITKCHIAHKVAQLGITVHIANGKTENILSKVLGQEAVHTRFLPKKTASGKKKWIAHSENYAKGVVQINEGARAALYSEKATSLLPVGVIKVIEDFQKGDIIKLIGEDKRTVGLGIAEYGAEKARERIGVKKEKPLVHYDYLFLNADIN